MSKQPDWLTVEQREAPLIVSFPHTGTDIPADIEARCVSPWLARKDAGWWIDQLCSFARELDATIVHTRVSRTVIDVNRDPSGASSCAAALQDDVAVVAAASPFTCVLNGRFKGGYITRAYGAPANGIHAVQMELACRGYMHEPIGPVSEGSWPTPFDPEYAAPIRNTLRDILQVCLRFAKEAA